MVGPDYSIVLGEQGDFAGFWPEGFTVELRDPATGGWKMLGDLSDQSSFVIDDVDSALSPTGLIEVRITGTSDAGFGQAGVFVSAEVRGVLAP